MPLKCTEKMNRGDQPRSRCPKPTPSVPGPLEVGDRRWKQTAHPSWHRGLGSIHHVRIRDEWDRRPREGERAWTGEPPRRLPAAKWVSMLVKTSKKTARITLKKRRK